MLYFHLQPNYNILSKYYTFPYSLDQMYNYHKDGYDIVLDIYDSDEKVEAIEDRFKKLIAKYDLEVHYDNLFFLALGKVGEIENVFYELNWSYNIKRRTKELAGLLLAFAESTERHLNGLLLKTFNSTAKISDSALISFIGTLITTAVRDGKTPLNLLEFDIDKLLLEDTPNGKQLSIEKIKLAATATVTKPNSQYKSTLAEFCFYMYGYLVNETDVKTDETTLISDRLLNFYFDLLVLFEFIIPDEIESEPKDYMRSVLMNYFKKLNPHYQGNKSK